MATFYFFPSSFPFFSSTCPADPRHDAQWRTHEEGARVGGEMLKDIALELACGVELLELVVRLALLRLEGLFGGPLLQLAKLARDLVHDDGGAKQTSPWQDNREKWNGMARPIRGEILGNRPITGCV